MLLGLLGLTNEITVDLRNSILKYSSSERATVSALFSNLFITNCGKYKDENEKTIMSE